MRSRRDKQNYYYFAIDRQCVFSKVASVSAGVKRRRGNFQNFPERSGSIFPVRSHRVEINQRCLSTRRPARNKSFSFGGEPSIRWHPANRGVARLCHKALTTVRGASWPLRGFPDQISAIDRRSPARAAKSVKRPFAAATEISSISQI
jgi:hypothetical protein